MAISTLAANTTRSLNRPVRPAAAKEQQAPAPADTFVHPDSTGKIQHLVLQLDGNATPQIRKEVEGAWTKLFKNMDSDVNFTITLENEKDRQGVKDLLKREDIPNPERFNLQVADDLNITMWARDQMVGLGNVGGGNTLLGQTTMRPHGDDELLPPRIAASVPGLGFDGDKRLQTDGGDEVSNPHETFLGYSSLYLTAKRMYEADQAAEGKRSPLTPFDKSLRLDYADGQVKSPDFKFQTNLFKSGGEDLPQQEMYLSRALNLFEEKYGHKVTIIGGDDPSTPIVEKPATFHMDMGMTPIDSDKILVGDPSIAVAAVNNMTIEERADHNARLNAALGLPANNDTLGELVQESTVTEPDLQHNFDVNAKKVADEGYMIDRLPYLQGPPGRSWVTYNNCLMESYTRDDGSKVRRVFLPTYDLPVLDGIAKQTYEKQGFEVIPLTLPALTSWRGAIRCISNVLDRKVTDPQTPPAA
ncbi:MAG: hypothetical protein J0I12_03135 [Candidatus Eremiobacteraeota bacterium]|nr:hypothetical protein [Candidatus Eremiobacteraeota bacterium]